MAIAAEQERAAREAIIDGSEVPEPSEGDALEAWELPDGVPSETEEA
jgi:hypothetical protein